MRPLLVLSIICFATLAPAEPATTFVLRDLATGQEQASDARLASEPVLPFSTFKVPNTLIGLETGVIPDEHFSLKWDGKKYAIAAWNRDQDLASALRESVVWFYQEVARRIGPPRMADWLHRLHYGNEKSTPAVDRFWLDGDLRITAHQEVDFFARMAKHDLPVSEVHVALVRRLLTLATDGPCTLEGKSGTGTQDGRGIAWLAGLLDTPGHHYAWAYLSRGAPGEATPSREERLALVKGLLRERGVYADCRDR